MDILLINLWLFRTILKIKTIWRCKEKKEDFLFVSLMIKKMKQNLNKLWRLSIDVWEAIFELSRKIIFPYFKNLFIKK